MQSKSNKTNKLELENLIKNYNWYHTMELAPNVVTDGDCDWRKHFEDFNFPPLKGKKILDVGMEDGFFSFEFEKRGGIVTALEIPSWKKRDDYLFGEENIRVSKMTEKKDFQKLFYIAKKALDSKVRVVKKNIYELKPENDGYYDIIFCNDLLLHLTDPFRALCILRSICKDTLIVGTPVYVNRRKVIDFMLNKIPLAYFRGHLSHGAFWIPTLKCLEKMIEGAGFMIEELFILKLSKKETTCPIPRGIVKCCIKNDVV